MDVNRLVDETATLALLLAPDPVMSRVTRSDFIVEAQRVVDEALIDVLLGETDMRNAVNQAYSLMDRRFKDG